MDKMKCIMLIGLPATGKSTFSSLYSDNYELCSSDMHIDKYAYSVGKTYDEVFQEYANEASKLFFEDVEFYVENKHNIIVDRTNMNVKARKKILSLIPDTYTKIAMVFNYKDVDVWKKRLDSRNGKTIPRSVINNMIVSYEPPSKEEGFDYIYEIIT